MRPYILFSLVMVPHLMPRSWDVYIIVRRLARSVGGDHEIQLLAFFYIYFFLGHEPFPNLILEFYHTLSTPSCEQSSVATSSNSNILDPLRSNYLPQPLDRKINKCFPSAPALSAIFSGPKHLRDILGPKVLAARGTQGCFYKYASTAIASMNYMKLAWVGSSQHNVKIRSTLPYNALARGSSDVNANTRPS